MWRPTDIRMVTFAEFRTKALFVQRLRSLKKRYIGKYKTEMGSEILF